MRKSVFLGLLLIALVLTFAAGWLVRGGGLLNPAQPIIPQAANVAVSMSVNVPVASNLPANTSTCPGALAPQLVVGGNGWVSNNDPRPVNLRATPGLNGAIIGSLPVGAQFLVVSGPICASDLNWFQVNYNGVVGWIAEGTTFYFVQSQ